MDRLAERIIDEVLATEVTDREGDLDRALALLSAARRNLAAAERDLRAWRHRRAFGHQTGMRAITAARFADFVPSAIPPGTHVEAVSGYLRAHRPTWELPSHGPRDAVRRAGAGTVRAARHAGAGTVTIARHAGAGTIHAARRALRRT